MTDTQTTATVDPRTKAARDFIQSLANLREHEKGKLAALRRNVGLTLQESHNVPWFFSLLAEGDGDQDIYFLVATLYGFNKYPFSGNFAKTLDALWQKTKRSTDKFQNKPQSTTARRLQILLDATLDRDGGGELAFRLRQLVKYTASKEVGIDWVQLLVDLRQWNHPKKLIQRKWAETFYTPPATEE